MGNRESFECRRCCCSDETDGADPKKNMQEWKPNMAAATDELPFPSWKASSATPENSLSTAAAPLTENQLEFEPELPIPAPLWPANFSNFNDVVNDFAAEKAPAPIWVPNEVAPECAPEPSQDIPADSPENSVIMIGQKPEDATAVEAFKWPPGQSDEGCPEAVIGNGTGGKKRFFVDLVREGEYWNSLGMLVSPDDDPSYLVIDDCTTEHSLIGAWNSTAPEELKVCGGHRIVSVNGRRGSAEDMLETIQETGKGSQLLLEIERVSVNDSKDELIF